jgi:SAM-dependent methyltransferase
VTNQKFDKTYFDRYYGKQPVRSLNEVAHLATAVHELANWWNSPIRSVLEVGAGPGDWSTWYRTVRPHVRVMSVDISEHACATYGHEQRDIATWSPNRPFDLVICMDVLQYLDEARAVRALRNLTKATRTYLYFDALTMFDARHTVDRSSTDLNAHLRSGDWYRRRLSRHFTQTGVGLWVRKGSQVVLHELERTR